MLKNNKNNDLIFILIVFQERNGIIEQTDQTNDKESKEEETNDDENNQDSNTTQKEFKSADTKATVTIIEDFNISDILENVSKKPRIDDEVTVIQLKK